MVLKSLQKPDAVQWEPGAGHGHRDWHILLEYTFSAFVQERFFGVSKTDDAVRAMTDDEMFPRSHT